MRENLKNLRKKNNLTKVEVAKAIRMTERQYSRLECGSSYGSVKAWIALKELLGAESIDYLLEQTGDVMPKE